jgi:DNA-binding MarR family transcriptional regulator
MDTSTDESVEAAARALLTTSRALLGISVRSVAAAPVPVTVPQHRLLVLVSSEGPRRMGRLAEDLGVNQSNASRLVDRLVEQGLVRRVPDPEDGRASLVEVTDEGRALLDAVNEHRLTELRAIVEEMPARSRGSAAAVLRAFNRAAHERDAIG